MDTFLPKSEIGKEDNNRLSIYKNVSVSDIFDVRRISPNQLNWENLEINLEVDSIINLSNYPLVYK
jgi:hypothetical protein